MIFLVTCGNRECGFRGEKRSDKDEEATMGAVAAPSSVGILADVGGLYSGRALDSWSGCALPGLGNLGKL